MKHFSFGLIATALVLSTAQARAQDTADETAPAHDGHWSVLSGRTVGEGTFVVHPEVGYPGVSATFIYGMSDKVDVGGRLGFDYGSRVSLGISPGLFLQGHVKLSLMKRAKVSLALVTEPGLAFIFVQPTLMAIMFPIFMQLGIHPTDALAIVIGMDLDMGVVIPLAAGYTIGFAMPIGFGPGLEYRVDESLALTLNFRFGPGVGINQFGANVGFGFKALLGVAIKI
ncbi:MAG: hypothetical protein K1X64_12360 [Myxococcaceae bacterium]|nr:hypothetical protein [Myxococcaceae bacterium]